MATQNKRPQKHKTRSRPPAAQKTVQRSPKKAKNAGKTTNSVRNQPAVASESRQQLAALLVFAGAAFFFFLSIIDAGNVWGILRSWLFGLFGFCTYFLSLILLFVSVYLTLASSRASISIKLYEAFSLLTLICALIHIFANRAPVQFWSDLGTAFSEGIAHKNGGAVGAFLGGVLLLLFDQRGAQVLVCLLIFVFVMLITGTTLLKLGKMMAKPVHRTAKRIHNPVPPVGAAAQFNIDVPLGSDPPFPEHPVKIQKPEPPEAVRSKKASAPKPPKAPPLDEIVKQASVREVGFAKNPYAVEEQDAPHNESYRYPPITLLKESVIRNSESVSDEMKMNAGLLVNTLKSFGVETRIMDISRGPAVTRYELQPSAGVKISKITNLADDIALNLASSGVRIEAPIPNKAAVGIEVPNKITTVVRVREIVDSKPFMLAKSKLTVALGQDIAGNITIADLAKMPHLLIAGATGAGKSVCINSLIISLLYKSSPDDVRFLMVDPKVVELGIYNGIPHLLVPVVTDPRKAAGALGWAVTEMLNRYKTFADNNVRDLKSYNALAARNEELAALPQIVIIIDELADLMMVAPNEVEDSICRLAQMARAAGMHLVIATQRPSVDVITGIIKANIPSRVAFAVSSQVDSRTILDMAGAEKLLGRGDMLFYPVGAGKPTRVQGCFVEDKEIEAVVKYVKNEEMAEYDEEIIKEIDRQAVAEKKKGNASSDGDGFGDDVLPQAIECVIEAGSASTTLLQRRLRLGYARAARIMDELEERGVIGPFEGSKPRQVLMTRQQWLEMSTRTDA